MMDLYIVTVPNFIGQVVGFYEKFGFSVLWPMNFDRVLRDVVDI